MATATKPVKSKRHASALKAHRKALIRKDANYKVRSKVRTLTTSVLKEIQAKNLAGAKEKFRLAQSAWQKAAKSGIFNRNTAARKISRLAAKISVLTNKN